MFAQIWIQQAKQKDFSKKRKKAFANASTSIVYRVPAIIIWSGPKKTLHISRLQLHPQFALIGVDSDASLLTCFLGHEDLPNYRTC